MTENIYADVMAKGNPNDPAAAVTAPGAEAVTAAGALPPLSQQAFELMFGVEDPEMFETVAKQKPGRVNINDPVYEASMMQFDAPSNPRQADRASDVGGVAGKVVRLAQTFVGTPYVWGGSSPRGFDCSGFVQYVFRQMGVNLPRVSFQQAQSGPRVALGNLRPGDLVAWDNSSRNKGADHIAIYIGGGRIVEAPRPGVKLRIRKLGKNEGAWGVRVL